jgi:hypothetical protein
MKNIWMKKNQSKHASLAQQTGFGRAAFWHTFAKADKTHNKA